MDLQYASNEVATQVSQVENMISNGCDILVIASIDGSSLGEPLSQAKEAGIPVIAYDRLLMESDAVSYYATFDNYMVGQKQGEYIEEALNLKEEKGPFNIELVAGAPDDNNAKFFFSGAMDVLQPYIDEGVLVVKSGQTEFEKCATQAWDSAKAQDRMDTIIAGNYTDGTNLDAPMTLHPWRTELSGSLYAQVRTQTLRTLAGNSLWIFFKAVFSKIHVLVKTGCKRWLAIKAQENG